MADSVPSMEEPPEENVEGGAIEEAEDDGEIMSEGVAEDPPEEEEEGRKGDGEDGPHQVEQNVQHGDDEAEEAELHEEEEEEEVGRTEEPTTEHEDEEMEAEDEVRHDDGDEVPEGLEHEVEEEEEEEEEDDEGIISHGPGGQREKQDDEAEDENDEEEDEDEESNNNGRTPGEGGEVNLRKRSASGSDEAGPTKRQFRGESTSPGHDQFCWVCHKDGVQVHCKICPRSYHLKCRHLPDEPTPKGQAALEPPTPKSYICPECAVVMNAENLETRSEAMKQLTVDQLITMLKMACQRMKNLPGADPFLFPVDPSEAADYLNYIVYPMDLHTLEKNVKQRQYGSTEAFLADAQWMVHNSVVFNSATSPFTAVAKKLLKVCKQEIQEIETCHECYLNAHHKPDSWFIEACRRPHIVVWAKLKGFPFWPAKAMRIKDDMVDVRFFGQHDRAWVCMKDCFLYSEEMPCAPPKRNGQLLLSIEELNAHIEKLKERNGPFVFAQPRTPIGPQLSIEQIRKMLPEFKLEEEPPKARAGGGGLQAPKGKSPMTIRISSLKTNPTIVNNSLTDDESGSVKPKVKKVTKPAEPSPPEEIEEDDEEMEDKPKVAAEGTSKGILASALGGQLRVTRRTSISSGGSESAAPPGENKQRLARLTPKASPTSEEEGAAESGDKPEGTPPPESFLQSIGLRKTSDVSKPETPIGSGSSSVKVKDEPEDAMEEEEEEQGEEGETEERMEPPPVKRPATSSAPGGMKPQEILNLPPSKTGAVRYSLSKDISISAVDDHSGNSSKEIIRLKKPVPGARVPPGLIPQQGGRPRVINTNGGGAHVVSNQQQQRLMNPNQRLAPRPVVRGPGGTIMRPNMRMNPQRMAGVRVPGGMKKESAMVVESSSLRLDGQTFTTSSGSAAVQLNQVQSIQGAITLPGGTITVTPLAPIIGVPITTYGGDGGTVNGVALKQSGANGLPISVISPHESGQQSSSSSGPKSNPNKMVHPRRNLINQVPPSVGHLVQNLQKTLVEAVKSSMEQIVVEMVENSANTSGSSQEVKALKEENDKLRKQLLDSKHNTDVAVREIKSAVENDKKRALNEQRRQLEMDKMKAIEECKKKQWCARCGREAQFYCCWNTSYCGYPCQEDHWPHHMNSCSQSK